MANRRTLIALEFLSPEGYRLELKEDGSWWIVKPRTLGEAALQQARALLERAETCLPPGAEDEDNPPSLQQIGEHVAKTLGLRITHHRFKQR